MPAPKRDRRTPDPRIDALQAQSTHLHGCVEMVKSDVSELRKAVAENTEITKQIADILGTFRVTGQIAKWIAATAAAVTGVVAALKGWRS